MKEIIFNPLVRIFINPENMNLNLIEPNSKKHFELSSKQNQYIALFDILTKPRKLEDAEKITFEKIKEKGVFKFLLDNKILISKKLKSENYVRIWEKHNQEDFYYFYKLTSNEKYLDIHENKLERNKLRSKIYENFVTSGSVPSKVDKYVNNKIISLPNPFEVKPKKDFISTLLGRRTCRKFNNATISLDEISYILYFSFLDIKKRKQANYENIVDNLWLFSNSHSLWFNLYFIVHNVNGLEKGLYKYDDLNHRLILINETGVDYRKVQEVAIGQNFMEGSAISMFLTTDFYSKFWRYRYPGAYRSILITVGELAQKIIVVSGTLGLGVFETPAIVDENQKKYLGTKPMIEEAMYYLAIGRSDKK